MFPLHDLAIIIWSVFASVPAIVLTAAVIIDRELV